MDICDKGLRQDQLSDEELVDVLDTLPNRPLLAGRGGLRLSLAGAQTKLPVVLIDDRVALPAPGQPTTHILKPAIARFPHITENEALVMTLAAAGGLPVASVTAVRRRVRELSDAVSSHVLSLPASAALAAADGPALQEYAALISSRAERLTKTITT